MNLIRIIRTRVRGEHKTSMFASFLIPLSYHSTHRHLLFENKRLFRGYPTNSVRHAVSRKPSRCSTAYTAWKSTLHQMQNWGHSLLWKAVNYMNNQTEILRNFIHDGKVEISNNLRKQRMNPITFDLKNFHNIESKDAEENTDFTHSLVEICRLNDKNTYEYLLAL